MGKSSHYICDIGFYSGNLIFGKCCLVRLSVEYQFKCYRVLERHGNGVQQLVIQLSIRCSLPRKLIRWNRRQIRLDLTNLFHRYSQPDPRNRHTKIIRI